MGSLQITLTLPLRGEGNRGQRHVRRFGVHPLRETDLIRIKVDISREEMSHVADTQAVYS